MKITIKMMAVILTAILTISLICALVVPADAAQDKQLSIIGELNTSYYTTFVVVDEVTSVNYVVIALLDHSVSITPRLNADGSLYVTP